MKVYKSKIDVWLVVLGFGPLVYGMADGIINRQYEVLYVMGPIFIALIYLFSKTEYVVKEKELWVKAAFLVNQKINIDDIKSIKKTYNPLSAPALSINRLEIKYGNNFDYTLISPKHREEFVGRLLAVNPGIDVKL